MATTRIDGYRPTSPPAINAEENPSLSDLAIWVEEELARVASAMQGQEIFSLAPLYVAPLKPRDGMLVYADGTHWNPGSGAGPYARIAGVWTKLFP